MTAVLLGSGAILGPVYKVGRLLGSRRPGICAATGKREAAAEKPEARDANGSLAVN